VGLTILPPSCADCLEVMGASTSWSCRGLSRPALPFTEGLEPTLRLIHWVSGQLSPGVRGPGFEVDHVRPSGFECVERNIFMVPCSIKPKDDFTFTTI
jgi:hypothetical protein